MLRTLNYTGRGKILQKQALFSFNIDSGDPPEFQVALDIDASAYPANSVVYVEAYFKETRQRFCYGPVSDLRPPADRKLDKIDLSGPTAFRVLVVDESQRNGMLLGCGDNFRADTGDDDANKSSILPVRHYPLGQLPWRIFFEPGAAPELHLNSQIPNAIAKMRSDPLFQSLILPAALREVLTHYLWNDEDSEGDVHCERWMAFASMFGEERPNGEDPTELHRWVDEIVSAFSERFKLNEMLLSTFEGEEA